LMPADFHEKKSGETAGPNVTGSAPTTLARCQVIELAGPWKDKKIVFTDFRWTRKREIGGKN